jgi:hypothetical protein
VREARPCTAAVRSDPALRTYQYPSDGSQKLSDFYRADTETIDVMHILHGAMNFGVIFFPDE